MRRSIIIFIRRTDAGAACTDRSCAPEREREREREREKKKKKETLATRHPQRGIAARGVPIWGNRLKVLGGSSCSRCLVEVVVAQGLSRVVIV